MGYGSDTQIKLPSYRTGSTDEETRRLNTWTVSGVAFDTKGRESSRSESVIIVSSAGKIANGAFTVVTDNVLADGLAKNVVKAIVTDDKGDPLANQIVNFVADNGAEIINSVSTSANGEAYAELTNLNPGISAVTASFNGSSQRVNVNFTAGNSILRSQVAVVTNNAVADGVATNTVKIIVTDIDGKPQANQSVNFTASSGAIIPESAQTDSNGVAQVNLTSTVAGIIQVTASMDGVSQTIQVNFAASNSTLQNQLVVIADNAIADGFTANTVKMTVADVNGNPVANQSISFMVNNGAKIVGSATTDASGVVQAEVTSTQSGQTTVTASVAGDSRSIQITFKPNVKQVTSLTSFTAGGNTTRQVAEILSSFSESISYSVSPDLPAGLSLAVAEGNTLSLSGNNVAAEMPEKPYVVTVRDGNSGAETSFNVRVYVAPKLMTTQQVYSRVLSLNGTVDFTPIAFTGGDSTWLEISPALPSGLSIHRDTGIISGSPSDEMPETSYTLRVLEKNGSPTKTFTLKLTVVVGPDLTVNIPEKKLTQGTSSSFVPVSAVSPVGGALTFKVSPTLPSGLGLNSINGLVTGTPAAESAENVYTMTVRDGKSGAESDAVFKLAVTAPLKVTQKVYSRVLSIDNPITLDSISITGGVMPTVKFSPELPPGLLYDAATGTISGTPAVESPATTYAIRVTDANNSPERTVSLTLSVVKGPSLTVEVPAKTLMAGTFGSFRPISAASPAGGTLSYSISPALSAGLGLNSTNGIISGTPLAESADVTYTMNVRDGRSGASSSARFSINIVRKLEVVQHAYQKALKVNKVASFDILTISGGNSTNQYAITPTLPAGLQLLNDGAGKLIIIGTPLSLASKMAYTITVTNNSSGATINRTLQLSVE